MYETVTEVNFMFFDTKTQKFSEFGCLEHGLNSSIRYFAEAMHTLFKKERQL